MNATRLLQLLQGESFGLLLFGLECLTLVLLAYGQTRRRSVRDYWDSILLLMLAFSPLLLATATHAQLVQHSPVLFSRPWLSWVPSLASTTVVFLFVGARSIRRGHRLRTATAALAALSLGLLVTGVQLKRPSNKLAIVVAVDRSRSIDLVPEAGTRIAKELELARSSMHPQDLLGVLSFGADARLQFPLSPAKQQQGAQQVSVGRDATDIEGALRRAISELPPDASGRVVLVSDGAETRGNALRALDIAAVAKIPIDTVVLEQEPKKNVRVVSVSAPSSARSGETITLRVVVESSIDTTLDLRSFEDGQPAKKWTFDLHAGQDVLNLPHLAQGNGLRRYEVRISSQDASADELAEDNSRSTFVRVHGISRALVLAQHPDTARPIGAALSRAKMDVINGDLYSVPESAAGLAAYDLVVLCDIPARLLTPSQLSAVSSYARALGGGLLLMGSDQSFGPGGYGGTPIEEISPVSFDLKEDRRKGSLSEVIAIDYSGSMGANVGTSTKLELANAGAFRSAQLLTAGDQLGILHVDTEATWTLPLARPPKDKVLETTLKGVSTGGGGIYVDVALQAAYGALRQAKTSLKHVLLFADGADAEQVPEAERRAIRALKQGISTSVVALGRGKELRDLEALSTKGEGRFYIVDDAQRLPAVFAQETVIAARHALNEVEFVPRPVAAPSVLAGVDFSDAPVLRGYVVTLPKARAQILLEGPDGDPILAAWSLGLGQVAAFTSDYTRRWGSEWTQWPQAAQLFAQLGRSLARSPEDPGVRLTARVEAGSLVLVADALDGQGDLDSGRQLAVHVTGPTGQVSTVPLASLEPGRYGAMLPLKQPGAYAISCVELNTGKLVSTTGVELSPSDELQSQGSDRDLLRRLAEGSGGQLRDTLAGLFNNRTSTRSSLVDINLELSVFAALMLLLGVALRRIRLPSARAITKIVLSPRALAPATPTQAPAVRAPVLWDENLDHELQRTLPAPVGSSSESSPPAATSSQAPSAAQSAAEVLAARRRTRRQG